MRQAVRSSRELKVSMMRISDIRGGVVGSRFLTFHTASEVGGFIAEHPAES